MSREGKKGKGHNPCPARSPGGVWLCDKEAGHFGLHSARTGAGRERYCWPNLDVGYVPVDARGEARCLKGK